MPEDDNCKWVSVLSAEELPVGQMAGVEIDGRRIAIFNVKGAFYATDNICTHAFAVLSDGWFEENVIECPLHGGKFDVCSGRVLGEPVERDLQTYPTRLAGGEVQIALPSA
ncbi:MAG: non-heme iron oxygenase ferredoxin subunit [Mesorhizobium sp.]|uniref:non-heme iron oxygenase ferredoxin subunit n=1 Tax=Mesorhizobium sp. TaxID=1871066 RepID=UPI000FE72C3C|nr:non-heme iron oxygenase ferredoxin subunit [Mesorhizobium sp.]RWE21532.1 MAG: non-heme iron oxygenase ferredoxin subunit [Mesorhizobium sp.]